MSILMRQAEFVDYTAQASYCVSPEDLNGYGMMHGGRLLTLCDEIAYLAAQRHARCICLTRAVHQARFHRGLNRGEHIRLRATLGLVGKSSLWVGVEVWPEADPEHRAAAEKPDRPAMDAVFVFAAVDESLAPVTVPPLRQDLLDHELNRSLQRLRQQALND